MLAGTLAAPADAESDETHTGYPSGPRRSPFSPHSCFTDAIPSSCAPRLSPHPDSCKVCRMWKWATLLGTFLSFAGCGSADGSPDASSAGSAGNGGTMQTAGTGGSAGTGGLAGNAGTAGTAGTTQTAFTDPNPMPCGAADADVACRVGWQDPSGGQLQWTGCCLTSFAQNPDGKCGISLNGGECVERKTPGNLDPNCGTNVSWRMQQTIGDDVGCCAWRTGTCGAASRSYGCVEPSIVAAQDVPCVPDYSSGWVAE
jgi:hypothetical protein